MIQFNGHYARKKCPHVLRRVIVWDEKNKRQIVLLTNHPDFGSTTISAIYKDRWQIELFFKALKQHLKVKTLILTRLPFEQFNHPLFAAQAEKYTI